LYNFIILWIIFKTQLIKLTTHIEIYCSDQIITVLLAIHLLRNTGVNFNNILSAHFSYKIKLSSFSLLTFAFVIFFTPKHWHKMLMKLTPGRVYMVCENIIYVFNGLLRIKIYRLVLTLWWLVTIYIQDLNELMYRYWN